MRSRPAKRYNARGGWRCNDERLVVRGERKDGGAVRKRKARKVQLKQLGLYEGRLCRHEKHAERVIKD